MFLRLWLFGTRRRIELAARGVWRRGGRGAGRERLTAQKEKLAMTVQAGEAEDTGGSKPVIQNETIPRLASGSTGACCFPSS